VGKGSMGHELVQVVLQLPPPLQNEVGRELPHKALGRQLRYAYSASAQPRLLASPAARSTFAPQQQHHEHQ